MENETRVIESVIKDASDPGKAVRKHVSHRRYGMIVILLSVPVLAFVAGMAGSAFERRFSGYVAVLPFAMPWSRGNGEAEEKKSDAVAPSVLTDPSDRALVDIVERSSPSVVSVVVTKEIVRTRGGFESLPFYFGPFGFDTDTDGQDRSDQGVPEKQKVGSGTGFFVSSDGLVVTNKHVVSNQTADYTVVLSGGKEYSANVLAVSPNQDIAVLKIDGADFPSLPLGDSGALRVGQTAIAIGNPLGEFPNSVSRGIISGLNRNVTAGSAFGDAETLSDIIQTDAAINPGNSGGPLLDIAGNVIGINVAVAQGAENIGFAIPIDRVKRVIDDVKTTGKISTPYLGVRYAMIDAEIAEENGLPYPYGAIVVRGSRTAEFAVVPGSPADKAGIVENDIILEIDGTRLDTDHPLGNVVADRRSGDVVTLRVWHKGEEKEMKATLEERK